MNQKNQKIYAINEAINKEIGDLTKEMEFRIKRIKKLTEFIFKEINNAAA